MKIIGLIGGTTWVSTLDYYRIINESLKEKLGGLHSAHCILYSVDFDEFVDKNLDDWGKIADSFVDVAKKLELAGADFIIICANTIHKIYDEIEKNVNIPILHIADATAEKILEKNIKKVGLLGTKYTMGEDFYKKRLKDKFGIEVVLPDLDEQKIVHGIIIDELTNEIINDSSKQEYIKIINNLVSKGAEGIILGCTEIPLLINQKDVDIPVFDTLVIHAKAAVELSLK